MMSEKGSDDSEMKFNGVFKSLDAVKKCLREKYSELPEVQELLKIFAANYTTPNEVLDRSKRKVFIVLEGIDASGKTTIGHRLAKLISGQELSTPPPALLPLREKFDRHEMELRRAYYSLGNYLAAQQVQKAYTTDPVIMDRFWHSTAAYAIAQQAVEQHNGTLPPEGHDIYEWPSDLIRPDIVFFLSVSESKRIDRLLRRKSKPVTREELKINDNKPLREALEMTFSRMHNPARVPVDSNVIIEDVLLQMKKILKAEFQIELPEIESYVPENETS